MKLLPPFLALFLITVSPGLSADPVEVDHAPLLARQAALPEGLVKGPVATVLLVLGPDIQGQVVSVEASYDTLENPSEVEVKVTEGGILDDDLHGFHHFVSLALNKSGDWHVVGYRRGEIRRKAVN